MTVVYDTGVLIAADRNERRVWAEHRARLEAGLAPVVTAPVVAQASRSPRQVPLRRFLRGCNVVAFKPDDSHEVGVLLNKARLSDVVDAHLIVVASRAGQVVLTSDLPDLGSLAANSRPAVEVRPVTAPDQDQRYR